MVTDDIYPAHCRGVVRLSRKLESQKAREMYIQGREVPPHLTGELVAYTGPRTHAALAQTFAEHGYVLLRGALSTTQVQAAAAEVFGRLAAEGEICQPALDRQWTGGSNRAERNPNLGTFWQNVCEGPRLRDVSHGTEMRGIVSALYGEPCRPFDLMYMRPTIKGEGTALHADFTFFAADPRDEKMVNAWIPFSDVPVSEGPLVVVEKSHSITEIAGPLRDIEFVDKETGGSAADADRMTQVAYRANPVLAECHPIEFAEHYRTRLLTTAFQPGDVIIISMFLIHGACDHIGGSGSERTVRLSVDIRFQPEAHPTDDIRWFGRNPRNSTGGGYGGMSGAKPLGVVVPADRMEGEQGESESGGAAKL